MKAGQSLLMTCVLAWGAMLLTGADSAYAPLQLYSGSWKVARKGSPVPEELKNQCQLIGKFYACQQSVDGNVSALLILVPTATAGHYATQSVNPEGRALGKGELAIAGNQWVFSSIWNQGNGRDVYYKTIDVFNGRDHIHFEQQESTNGRDWKVTNSGDETRVAVGR